METTTEQLGNGSDAEMLGQRNSLAPHAGRVEGSNPSASEMLELPSEPLPNSSAQFAEHVARTYPELWATFVAACQKELAQSKENS
jgi:hypothetical protein